MSPEHLSQRSYYSALVIWRVVSFILLCLCGFLIGGAGVFLVLLLLESNEILTFFPLSPFEIVVPFVWEV